MSETRHPLRQLVESRRDEINSIVKGHQGRSVSLFGSVARGQETARSDLDFLVELESGARPFQVLTIGVALEEALGVKVDIGTLESLREEIRERVLAEAILL